MMAVATIFFMFIFDCLLDGQVDYLFQKSGKI